LEVNINELTSSEKELEVKLNYDEIKTEIESEVLKQTKKIQLPGFRKGKAPLSMLKKMYGDALEHEASEKIANSKFWAVAKDKELKPIGTPQLTDIKFNPGENLSFKVRYETIPDLKVEGYTGKEIEIPNFVVKDGDVEHEIEHIIRANGKLEETDTVGASNNYIIKAEVQRLNEQDEPFEGSKPELMEIDFTNHGINPEILENAKDKKVEDSFNFSFTDERKIKNNEGIEETKSETFRYSAVIKDIKRIALPELNEELIKKVTKDKVTTTEQFKEEIKKDIQAYLDQRTNEILRDRLMMLIVKENDFVPPAIFVNNILEDMIKREEEEAKKQRFKKFDRNEAYNRLKPAAELEVKWFLLKDAIQKQENISVTDDELNELAKKEAEKTGIGIEKLINYYKSSNLIEKISDKKLFDFLKEKNQIKKVELPTKVT